MELFHNIWIIRIIWSIVIIIISLLLYKIVTDIIVRNMESDRFKILSGKKTKTYIKLTKSISRYIFIVGTFLILLDLFGVNISSVIAGVGVLGIVFGLAIQDWIKDIIRGSTILSDNYFAVGDIVKYKNIEGKVLILGLKTTKIEDIRTNNIISIANRNIDEIEVLSGKILVKIPLSYDVSIKKAEEVVQDIKERVMKYPNIQDCKYLGVSKLADSCIEYLLKITCNPLYKPQVERDTLRTILLTLEDYHLEVPYQQIDIHQK